MIQKHQTLLFFLLALGFAVFFILNLFSWSIAGMNPVFLYTILFAVPVSVMVAILQIRKIPGLRMRRMLRVLLIASLFVSIFISAGRALQIPDTPTRQDQSDE